MKPRFAAIAALILLSGAIAISLIRQPPKRQWQGHWKGVSEFCLADGQIVNDPRGTRIESPVRIVEKPWGVLAEGTIESLKLQFSDRDPQQANVSLIAGVEEQPVGMHRRMSDRCPKQ